MSCGTYFIVNLLDRTRYIGSAVNLESRRRTHFCALRKGVHFNRHLQSSFSKYGEQNFYFSVTEEVDDKENLLSAEQEFIDLARAAGWRLYNHRLIAKSNLGMRHAPESLLKMSKATKGRRLSHAHRMRLREFRLGKKTGPMSAAKKLKISATRLGIIPWNKGKTYKLKRVEGRSHPLWEYHRSKTHCPEGHSYDAANTYVAKSGNRQCRECTKLRMRNKRTADRKARGVEGKGIK